MKKLLSLFLMVTLLMTALVSCGKEETSEEDKIDLYNDIAKDVFNITASFVSDQEVYGDTAVESFTISFKMGDTDDDNESIRSLKESVSDLKDDDYEDLEDECYLSITVSNWNVSYVKASDKSDMSTVYGQWPDPIKSKKDKKDDNEESLSDADVKMQARAIIDRTQITGGYQGTYGELISKAFYNYEITAKNTSGSEYLITFTGEYCPVPNAQPLSYSGSITFRVDLESGSCMVDSDPNGIESYLVAWAATY